MVGVACRGSYARTFLKYWKTNSVFQFFRIFFCRFRWQGAQWKQKIQRGFRFFRIFFFCFCWHGILWEQNFKTYLSFKSFSTFPYFFFSLDLTKVLFGIFEIQWVCDFWWFLLVNVKFAIVPYVESKTSIICKMSSRRAKLSEIWDSWVLVEHMGYLYHCRLTW